MYPSTRRALHVTLFLALIVSVLYPIHLTAQGLSVSENGRYLVQQNGSAFFWLGDTAWELFHRLDREEADLYLKTRAKQGFTVIQAVVLAELNGLEDPNPYGEVPLVDLDPTRPNEAYFEHVDYIVDKAEELGLVIGMLPTWGDKWVARWGVGPEVFTPENARVYGRFLGARYKDRSIIWLLGGDRIPDNEEHIAIIRAMAAGIEEGDDGAHLKTFHPQGGRASSEFFHDDEWLDFNMYQSGHGEVNNPNYRKTEADYNREPIKPVLDGEPNYEDHPINWRGENGWFDAFDSRRAGYWSMLSGAMGHTYGNHNIWQMWQPGRDPISVARTPWREALTYPGAWQAGYMRAFFESMDWWTLEPAQTTLLEGPNTAGKEIRVGIASNQRFLMAYTPFGSGFTLNLEQLRSGELYVKWFHPATGTWVDGGAFSGDRSQAAFDPPGDEAKGNDWVLVVEESSVESRESGIGREGR